MCGACAEALQRARWGLIGRGPGIWIYAFLLGLGLVGVSMVAWPLDRSVLHSPQAYRYYARDGELAGMLISEDGLYRMHSEMPRISSKFIDALILIEDRYFYYHPGVNPVSILRAVKDNIVHGRVVSGASTITMQLARMLKRRPRTLWNKAKEAVFALRLEWHLTKDEILEQYIMRAPYGGNIEGVEAAARLYFGKTASQLSYGESALLVGVPRAPNRLRPDRFPEAARLVRDRVLQRMLDQALLSKDAYARAKMEPVRIKRRSPNNIMPHLTHHLRSQHPNAFEVPTTIDFRLQQRASILLRQHLEAIDQHRVKNAAAVVIDSRSHEVLAWVGSGDYFSESHSGAIDGVRAPRSPGSTLKPFVYGLALERGLITPKKILFDIPRNYGGYEPQNYSKDFRGTVSAHEALIESLNVVAVRLSEQMGVDALHGFLLRGGVSTLHQSAGYYGLPLVLGGAELRLLELTNLYATLANMGRHQKFKVVQSERRAPPVPILSEGASWLVAEMLSDVERPDFPESWQFSRSRPKIAWKTGTSYGHQDAWSIGFTPKVTVGVWVGNFDGAPSQGLVGREAAAPLLFDLMQSAAGRYGGAWFARPASVGRRRVCETCGTLPGRVCGSLVKDYYLKGVQGPVNTELCDIPQEISIDLRTNTQATESTPQAFVAAKVYHVWPPEVAAFLSRSGVPVHRVPPYDLQRLAGQRTYPPKILSPAAGSVYLRQLDRFEAEDHGIKLSGAATNRIRKVAWILNGRLLGWKAPSEELMINPPPGRYTLILLDEVGGKAEVRFRVRDDRPTASDG